MANKKPIGTITRGTTNPNRLRRVDRFIAAHPVIKQDGCVVVDLGYGASPITAVEIHKRLRKLNESLQVVGIEIDRERVERGLALQVDGLSFLLGGFETPLPNGLTNAHVIRAFNVLRQYDESEVAAAWKQMQSRLHVDGILVEGTCDEIGRLSSWVLLDSQAPQSFTISLHLGSLEKPSDVAERLPKILIHHNVAGEAIHRYLSELDACWAKHAPLSSFGVVQRWLATCESMAERGWPIRRDKKRWRLGELTVDWSAVAPTK
ncbi:MAG: class I SAM-dependent methyltransferase [Microbacteriaceae bacterium]